MILAAGASRRMGTNKLLLPVDGAPMVRVVVERAQAAKCSPIVVVLGHEPERLREALAGLEVAFAENPDFTGPTSGSLHAGLRALGTDVDATVVLLADMVHVTAAMIGTLVEAARTDTAPLQVSRYGDVLAPPLLFRRALWPELLAWTGEGCGKSVVMAHRAEAGMHDWPQAALQDVDTPADYDAVRRTRP
ncbi:MAG: nucleotidyltransferase family protein [Gemmatimonadaceae bacterium]